MSDGNNAAGPAIGIDVGTSRIVAAHQAEKGFRFESQLNAFVSLPQSRMTENSLRKERIPYTAEQSDLLVYGDASERFADLRNGEMRRPMLRGLLNPREPDSAKIIGEILRLVASKPGENRRKAYFTAPAAPQGAEENLTYHEAALRQIFADLGYDAVCINEGLAIVYSEMENSNYTGIGISCGGGLCNACFAYLSVPVFSFSIPKAGDFIDSSAAGIIGEPANRVRMAKEESFFLNGHYPSKLHQAVAVYYEDMIRTLVTALKDAFGKARAVPKLKKPIPLVLSGGTSLPAGFRERFEEILEKSGFPVSLSEVRMAADPLTAAAKGALMAALSEA